MDITAIIGPIFPNMLITLFIPRRTEHNVIIAKINDPEASHHTLFGEMLFCAKREYKTL